MGFRKNRSTLDSLAILEQAIQDSFLARSHLVAVFFDLEKAYDRTWRYGILQKLQEWGIKGNIAKFIRGFLTDRSFKVRIGDTLSEAYLTANGIPQGSTLSVTLFGIAVNDLITSIPERLGKCMYVDDLVLFYSGDSMAEITQNIQEGINTLVEVADNKGFRFSDTKTICMHFCRKRIEHNEPILYLNESRIEIKSSVKFLGIIFDSKLTWVQHIEDLANRCKKSLNILRCLSHLSWGADRETLLLIYKSLIRSRIDYGSVIYSSARKSRLKILDTIQCTGIRLAIGAFRTSPLDALCCEAGISPLKLRRSKMMLNYAVSKRSQPRHPNYISFTNEQLTDEYKDRPSVTRPLCIRVQEVCESLDISLPRTLPLGFCEIPPWTITVPECVLECTIHPKGETSPFVLKATFYDILNKYPQSQVIYTDGSKIEAGVGCAFVKLGEAPHSWSLPSSASIFTAELYAIWQALLYCEHSDSGEFLICTDSLSAIQAIKNPFTWDPMVQQVLALVHHLNQPGKTIRLVWTPAHIGIRGNELADSEARNAAASGNQEDIAIRPDDVKIAIDNHLKNVWQQEWNRSETQLRLIKPIVTEWHNPINLSRKESVVLTRIRIGHTRLTSLHLLRGERRPICPHCNISMTIKHAIQECPYFNGIREHLNIPDTLEESLSNDTHAIETILRFLKDTNIFSKI